ncbi:MAG: hypothetical protein LQ352_001546 [Teloschistes flavicans]|nr:MAG: hypothetical protein LQ352_001546 [Teloschistes flavicans]
MSSASFYPPSASTQPSERTYPTTDKLVGKWYITHTTSPAWKDKRNVVLTYTALPSASNTVRPQLDDLITYQTLGSQKLQTMRGTDTPSPFHLGSWTWRGNGWLKFVTSQWEIVAHEGGPTDGEDDRWMVVFAQKSIFTPAVLNIYTNGKIGLEDGRLDELRMALKGLGNEELGGLADGLYRVTQE